MTGKRVLIVDDAGLVRLYYRNALERAGYTVDEAMNGLEALEKLLITPADLLIVDINMPKMNGMELLVELKQNPRLVKTPIYMYSTSDQKEIVAKCMELGASGFMKKSPDIEEMRRDFFQLIDSRLAS